MIKNLTTEEYGVYITCFALNSKGIPQGVAVLEPSMRDKCNIAYIATDPNVRGKGLCTRMITSISDNIQEFMGYYREINEITALVRTDNTRIQKVLKKCDFVCKPTYGLFQNGYNIYTLTPKNNEMER